MTAGYLPISDRQHLRAADAWSDFGILVVLLAVTSIPLAIVYGVLADHHALKAEWAIVGPACAVPSEPIRFHRPAHAFTYRGVTFSRRYGNAYCIVAPDGNILSRASHTVCQFSSPGAVSVTTGGRTVLYEPGIGHPATVSIRDGRSSCVVGGWFR